MTLLSVSACGGRRHGRTFNGVAMFTLAAVFAQSPAFSQCRFQTLPSDAGRERFGVSVALDGDLAVIGAMFADTAHVFERGDDGRWIETARLIPSIEQIAQFGLSVDINDGRIIVGSPALDVGNERNQGACYIFQRNDQNEWVEVARLLDPNGNFQDALGTSVALDGDVAVAGAIQDADTELQIGYASVFRRGQDGQWRFEFRLNPSNGTEFDQFGTAVEIQDDTIFVGSPFHGDVAGGSVYLYRSTGKGDWIEDFILEPPQGVGTGSFFGMSIQIDGDRLAVGASRGEVGVRGGAATTFLRTNEEWILEQVVAASDAQAGAAFGGDVALRGDWLIVGAMFDSRESTFNGAAYVFRFDHFTSRWEEVAKLTAAEPEDRLAYGSAVAARDDGVGFVSAAGRPGFMGEEFVDIYLLNGCAAELVDLEIVTGIHLLGGVEELREDDGRVLHVLSGFNDTVVDLHLMEMIVTARSIVDAPAVLDITVAGWIDEPAGTARVLLRDRTTNRFEEVGRFPIGLDEESVTLRDIDAASYVDDGGAIDLMLRHSVFAPMLAFRFENFIDHVAVSAR